MQSFLTESVAHGCEGLMVKTLVDNASYEPSKRSLNWLKVLIEIGDYEIAEERLFEGFG